MKTIIAGSRNIKDADIVEQAIKKSGFTITEVVSGGARGVDRMGENWAKSQNIKIKQFKPDWSKGRGAGFIANKEMAKYAQAAIVIWDGESKGTKDIINNAKKEGLKLFVKTLTE